MTRVLVCGSRDWDDAQEIWTRLDAYSMSLMGGITLVIHGAAHGADTIAGKWAKKHKIPVEEYLANWNEFHKSAGPIRNRQMLKEGRPELVIAFHSDIAASKGTRDMVMAARKAGIPVFLEVGKTNY